jgi:hypothetical protein
MRASILARVGLYWLASGRQRRSRHDRHAEKAAPVDLRLPQALRHRDDQRRFPRVIFVYTGQFKARYFHGKTPLMETQIETGGIYGRQDNAGQKDEQSNGLFSRLHLSLRETRTQCGRLG